MRSRMGEGGKNLGQYSNDAGWGNRFNQWRADSNKGGCIVVLRLYIFAVCDKVILDASNTASLICLFNEVHMKIPKGSTEVPDNSVSPKEWAVFTSWKHDPEDAGDGYEQVLQVLYPDWSIFKESKVKFSISPEKTHHQVTFNLLGFPTGRQGTCRVRISLHKNGETLLEPDPIDLRVIHEHD